MIHPCFKRRTSFEPAPAAARVAHPMPLPQLSHRRPLLPRRPLARAVRWLGVGMLAYWLGNTWTHAATAPGIVPGSAERQAAAQATANGAACAAARPFYWEIGDAKRPQAFGSVGEEAPDTNTTMAIASATKWLYAAYVAEKRGGQLSDTDVSFLNFTSGYTRFRTCRQQQTVEDCANSLLNGRGRIDAKTVGRFDYNGGHMQRHAVMMGLGALDNTGLAGEMRQVLGTLTQLGFRQPQLAGGAEGTPAAYARFLRRLLDGDLKMGALLGTHAVCTNPATCPQAVSTPIPDTESWHYSIGHWVEDDPVVGDGAFSSPGAFGFYPWISADRQFYGLLAREARNGLLAAGPGRHPAIVSVACGRLIRKAWLTGQPQ